MPSVTRTRYVTSNAPFEIGLAVGGWSAGTANFEAKASNTASRAAFVKNLSDLCGKYSLDGIDMDWEYPKAGSAANFTLLMKELSDALKPKGRFLSTAVISAGDGTGQYIHKEVFGYIDYLNIMSYDGIPTLQRKTELAQGRHVVRIHAPSGRLVHESSFLPGPDGQGALAWNAGSLPKGVYALRAQGSGRSFNTRFVHSQGN